MRKNLLLLLAAATAAICFSSSASAALIVLGAELDPFQEVPPHNTPGYGSADATLDTVTGVFTILGGSYADLLAGATTVKLYDGAVGTNGSVIGLLTLDTPGNTSGTYSGMSSSNLTAGQITDAIAGNTYLNITDSVYPSGENPRSACRHHPRAGQHRVGQPGRDRTARRLPAARSTVGITARAHSTVPVGFRIGHYDSPSPEFMPSCRILRYRFERCRPRRSAARLMFSFARSIGLFDVFDLKAIGRSDSGRSRRATKAGDWPAGERMKARSSASIRVAGRADRPAAPSDCAARGRCPATDAAPTARGRRPRVSEHLAMGAVAKVGQKMLGQQQHVFAPLDPAAATRA